MYSEILHRLISMIETNVHEKQFFLAKLILYNFMYGS